MTHLAAIGMRPQAGTARADVEFIVDHQSTDGDIRVLSRGAQVYQGDVVRTSRNSAAVLNLKDGTRMALRPETTFRIENYSEARGQESAIMRLFKGGLRSISSPPVTKHQRPTPAHTRLPLNSWGKSWLTFAEMKERISPPHGELV